MTIKVETTINASLEKVWELWTNPKHITQWNFASNEWCCPTAINDLKPNGDFVWRMEAKDGSIGFDFIGTYQTVIINEFISYKMEDGRIANITFSAQENGIQITEEFETEGTNSDEQQRAGWQSILENFKKYVESIETF
ncbi:SRPBCC domain-containing protein [Polaribacter gochangensis]|uniref:SRPBCC domain-containing protein n=1 Tax=Polaribacter gochangensis TaxID=3252903 RepID=UPI0039047A87